MIDKFAPSPWVFNPTSGIVLDANGLPVVFLAAHMNEPGKIEAGFVLAAAPTLLERLQQLVAAIDAGQLELSSPDIQTDENPPHSWHEEWLHHARASIAKALGMAS